jgi:hypothetical protein
VNHFQPLERRWCGRAFDVVEGPLEGYWELRGLEKSDRDSTGWCIKSSMAGTARDAPPVHEFQMHFGDDSECTWVSGNIWDRMIEYTGHACEES